MTNRPTGCVLLGRAIREACAVRGVTFSRLAALCETPIYENPISRVRVSQWAGAHRAISPKCLWAIEKALDVKFEGINRNAHSEHHALPVCRADLAEGPFVVTCLETGNALYPVTREETAA